MLLPVLSAFLQFLGFPPVELHYLSLVALAPLLYFLVREADPWRLGLGILLYRFLFLISAGSYIPEPLLVVSELAFFLPFIFFIIVLKKYATRPPALLALAAFAFLLTECVAARFAPLPSFVVLSGLPLAATPFVGLARFGWGIVSGPYVVTGFALLINFLSACLLLNVSGRADGTRRFDRRARAVLLLLGIALVAGYGAAVLPRAETGASAKTLRVAIFSTGSGYDDASGPSAFSTTTAPLIKARVAAVLADAGEKLGEFRPELTVFPEALFALFYAGDMNAEARERFDIVNAGTVISGFQDFAKEHRTAVFTGLTTLNADGEKHRSAILIDAEGRLSAVSDKYYLTTGSEWWPFGTWVPFYWRWSLWFLPPHTRQDAFAALSPTGQYTPAAEPFAPMTLGDLVLAPLLCSEGHYPEPYRAFVASSADLFISNSSDGWLSFSVGQFQRETVWLKTLYAVSSGRPVVISGKQDAAGIAYPSGIFEGVYPQTGDALTPFTKALEL